MSPNRIAFAALLIVLSSTARAGDDGLQPIFDGKSLDGWIVPDARYWSVEDGAITGRITKQRPLDVNQYIVWRRGPWRRGRVAGGL